MLYIAPYPVTQMIVT